jgi:hypothetical protein
LVSIIINVEFAVGLIIINLVWIVNSVKSNAPPVTSAPQIQPQVTMPVGRR